METKEEIIIDVQFDAAKAAQQMADATNQVRILKQEQKLLTKAFEEGTIADQDYAKAMAESKAELEKANREIKSSTALLQLSTTARVNDTMSLDEQRQVLNAAQKAYANLKGDAKAAADAEGGLRDQINALSDSVKKQEAAIGDNRRNVGNYAESLKNAASQMGVLGSGIVNATTRMQQAKTIMSAIAAHPLIAILGALVLVFKKIGDAIKNNAAAMESLTGVFGAFAGVGMIVDKVIEKIAEGLGWIGEKALGLADKLGLLSKEMKEGQAIAKEDLAIQKAQRDAALKTAEDQKKIAELRAQATDKTKYSAQERIKFLKEANTLEQGIADEQYALAKREYDLQVKKNAQSKSSQEDLKKENDLQIKMIQAETARAQKERELNAQITAATQEQIANQKEAAAARLEITRALEDSVLELERDATQKAVVQAQRAGEREVENLRVKLNNLKQADKKGREELQKLIEAKEKETQQKVSDILIKAQAEREEQIRANARAEAEIGVHSQQEFAQMRYENTQADYVRLKNLSKEYRDALYSTDEEYRAAVLAAEAAFFDAQEAQAQEQYEREQARVANEYENRKNAAYNNEVELANIEFEQAVADNERLVNMDEETKNRLYATQEDYEAAVIASNRRVMDAQKNAIDSQRKMAMANAQAVGGMMDALGNLLDQFGEENKEAAMASKMLALGKIAIDTGVAIAGGVAQAQSVPFPANIAAIATTITTVLTNMATAISTVKSAKLDAGKYSGGGTIPGTSYTGDKLIAHVNSGEGIYTGTQANNLLQEIANNPLRGANYDAMAAAMAAAVAELPAPVMDYTEFKSFEQNVSTYNEIARV